MKDCIFCRIAAGEIPSKAVYEDASCYAFDDIAPQAKVHVVLIPKKHVANVLEGAGQMSDAELAHLWKAIPLIAEKKELGDGFRVVTNCGKNGCQSVEHWHIHILGGEQLADRMA